MFHACLLILHLWDSFGKTFLDSTFHGNIDILETAIYPSFIFFLFFYFTDKISHTYIQSLT